MDREKLIKQLFIGKVADIIGFEKTTELLKEATNEIDKMIKSRKADVSSMCEHPWESIIGDGEMKPAKCLKCGKYINAKI
jgi:GTP cyclohydrolase I